MDEAEPLVGGCLFVIIYILKESNRVHDRKPNNGWVIAFVFLVSQAMVCKGLSFGLTGVTFNYLALNTNSTIDQLSSTISIRSLGSAIGSLTFTILKSSIKDVKIVATSGVVIFVMGSITLSTPFIHSLTLLVILQILVGFAVGFCEPAFVSLFLTSWGEVRSRPYVQLIHFMFTAGGIFTPLIAKPFLEMASQQQSPVTVCPGHYTTAAQSQWYSNYSESATEYETLNPVSWSYFIVAMYTIVISTLLCTLAASNIEGKLSKYNDEQIEKRPEKSVREIWMFSLSATMYSFFAISTHVVYREFLYSIVICCLKLAISDAAFMNFLFWIGSAIGRGSAIISSRYFNPSTIIIWDLIGTTSAMIMMSIWGETSAVVMWVGTFIHGFFTASLMPSGVSWSSKVTNMSGKYLSLLYVGGNVGAAVMSRVGGAVFQTNPFAVIFFVTGIYIAIAVCFVFMNLLKPKS